MTIDNVRERVIREAKDLHNAEMQLLKALRQVAKAASSEVLRKLFAEHLRQIKGHVERLQRVFETSARPASGRGVLAMQVDDDDCTRLMADSEMYVEAAHAAT
jgi:ferritin-like metal-binding protein YciE